MCNLKIVIARILVHQTPMLNIAQDCVTMLVMIHYLVFLTFLVGCPGDGADDAPPRFFLRRLQGVLAGSSSAALRLGATALALASRGALQFLPDGKGTAINLGL